MDSITIQYDPIELIIVVENSLNLAQRLRELKTKANIIYSPKPLGLSNARNLGIKNAKGEYIAFLDDDVKLRPGWSEIIAPTFENNPSILGMTGPVLPSWKGDHRKFPFSLYWTIGCDISTEPHYLLGTHGANMVYRREVFDRMQFDPNVGGSHSSGKKSSLVGEDVDFALKLCQATRTKIFYQPKMQVLHKVPTFKLKARYVARYSFYQGQAEARYSSKYGELGHGRREKLLNLIFTERISWHGFGLILVSLFFGGFGWLSYKLRNMFPI